MMPMRGCANNAPCRLTTWLAQVLPLELTYSRICFAQHGETVVDLAFFTWLLSIWLGDTYCGSVEAGTASLVVNAMSCRHNATVAKCLGLSCDQNDSRKFNVLQRSSTFIQRQGRRSWWEACCVPDQGSPWNTMMNRVPEAPVA
jgi:hypothetical protein